MTKGKQWIRLNKNVELLDTPGILWPKFEDQTVGLRLAFIGSIKDEILQTEELASELVKFLNQSYPGVLEEKYTIESSEDNYEVLRRIAESRHCLVRGSELDVEKQRQFFWMIFVMAALEGLHWSFQRRTNTV